MYAALAVVTWDTTKATRDEVVESALAFVTPTPDYQGWDPNYTTWPKEPRQRAIFEFGAPVERAIPSKEAWTVAASTQTRSSAQATRVLVDEEIVQFREWVGMCSICGGKTPKFSGPETGTHLVTVVLTVTTQSVPQAAAPERAGDGSATAERAFTLEVQCDPAGGASNGQCGVIRLYDDPRF